MDEMLFEQGKLDAATAADIAQMQRDQQLRNRDQAAREYYRVNILRYAQPGTRPHLELNAPTIIRAIAELMPLEPTQ